MRIAGDDFSVYRELVARAADQQIALPHLVDGDARDFFALLAVSVAGRDPDEIFDRLLGFILVGGVDQSPQLDEIHDDRARFEVERIHISGMPREDHDHGIDAVAEARQYAQRHQSIHVRRQMHEIFDAVPEKIRPVNEEGNRQPQQDTGVGDGILVHIEKSGHGNADHVPHRDVEQQHRENAVYDEKGFLSPLPAAFPGEIEQPRALKPGVFDEFFDLFLVEHALVVFDIGVRHHEVDARRKHARLFFQVFFQPVGTGAAGHALNAQRNFLHH